MIYLYALDRFSLAASSLLFSVMLSEALHSISLADLLVSRDK